MQCQKQKRLVKVERRSVMVVMTFFANNQIKGYAFNTLIMSMRHSCPYAFMVVNRTPFEPYHLNQALL
jgi:hypothetical protein